MVREQLKSFFSNTKSMLVWDIETIPDQDLVTKWYTEDEQNTFDNPYKISLGFHKPIAISFVETTIIDGDLVIGKPKVLMYDQDELTYLTMIYEVLSTNDKWVTFNGNRYDIPVLMKRTLIHGLKNPRYKILSYLYTLLDGHQWNKVNHLDLFDLLSFKGQKGGLRFLASLIGLEKYDNLQGKDMLDLYQNEEIDRIEEYAKQDALITAKCFKTIIDFFRTK